MPLYSARSGARIIHELLKLNFSLFLGVIYFNGAPRVWAEKNIFWAQNTDETAREAKWSFNKENREKTEEPSLGTSDNGATTAPWQLCKVHT